MSARGDFALPVIAMMRVPRRLVAVPNVMSSSVEPELEIAMTTSSPVIIPKSPCNASEGCTK